MRSGFNSQLSSIMTYIQRLTSNTGATIFNVMIDRDLRVDHRTGSRSYTRKPDRTIKLTQESAKLLPEKIFRGKNDATGAYKRNRSPTCAICCNDFKSGHVLKILPNCQHTFHSKCITKWLTDCRASCPLCMKEVSPQT